MMQKHHIGLTFVPGSQTPKRKNGRKCHPLFRFSQGGDRLDEKLAWRKLIKPQPPFRLAVTIRDVRKSERRSARMREIDELETLFPFG